MRSAYYANGSLLYSTVCFYYDNERLFVRYLPHCTAPITPKKVVAFRRYRYVYLEWTSCVTKRKFSYINPLTRSPRGDFLISLPSFPRCWRKNYVNGINVIRLWWLQTKLFYYFIFIVEGCKICDLTTRHYLPIVIFLTCLTATHYTCLYITKGSKLNNSETQ